MREDGLAKYALSWLLAGMYESEPPNTAPSACEPAERVMLSVASPLELVVKVRHGTPSMLTCSARPATFRDIELASRVPKPTFAAFARRAKEMGLVQTGVIHGYYYAITEKGRRVVHLSKRMDEALDC